MNASHRPAAVVAALGGLLEAFRQGRIVARSAERDGMERHAGPLTASWNARFPGFPSEDFPYTSFWGETRRARRDAHLIDVIVELLAGRPAGETTIVNAACVFGRHACRLAARLPEACVVGADIDPRWDRLYRLRQGRHVPSNYRFVQDDLFRPRLDVRLVSARSLGACRAYPGHDQHSRRQTEPPVPRHDWTPFLCHVRHSCYRNRATADPPQRGQRLLHQRLGPFEGVHGPLFVCQADGALELLGGQGWVTGAVPPQSQAC